MAIEGGSMLSEGIATAAGVSGVPPFGMGISSGTSRATAFSILNPLVDLFPPDVGTPGNLSTFARILSGEPLPKLPVVKSPLDAAELDKYHRDVNDFLRRLLGRLSSNSFNPTAGYKHFDFNGFVKRPDAADPYVLVEYALYDYKLVSITHRLEQGEMSFVMRVDGAVVNGTGTSTITDVQSTFTFVETLVTIGQRLSLEFPSMSGSPRDYAFTVRRERYL